MNKVEFPERIKPATKQALYVNRLFAWRQTESDGKEIILPDSIQVKSKFRVHSNYPIPQKDSDMSRGGTVPRGRILAHNPRPRTTGVGPATINFVINPTLQANAVDFVKKSAFSEGFYSLKKGNQECN